MFGPLSSLSSGTIEVVYPIESRTKWPRIFRLYFLDRKCFNLDFNFIALHPTNHALRIRAWGGDQKADFSKADFSDRNTMITQNIAWICWITFVFDRIHRGYELMASVMLMLAPLTCGAISYQFSGPTSQDEKSFTEYSDQSINLPKSKVSLIARHHLNVNPITFLSSYQFHRTQTNFGPLNEHMIQEFSRVVVMVTSYDQCWQW